MLSQHDSVNSSTNTLSQLAQNMFSDENNDNNIIMLAAIISLLLVILFVLLLHLYAKCFLAQSNSQSNTRRRQPSVSDIPTPSNFHHHFNTEAQQPFNGLNPTTVSKIPTFVSEHKTEELECVICLSYIEKGEIGRKLPKCGHAFHVECIDMWLNSHTNCPMCRSLIVEEDSHGGGIEIVIDDSARSYEISESGSVSVSETSLSLFGFSFKRIISKVFLSSHVNELDHGSQ
ncbi:RING-H2 finger protein ATL63-like [Vicia villosa]|uniref:RING-H2 finger protein ATL63-like n=1 Tax=Vicia villosa TaxID=3911 RepID=UPI00273B5155|nr:RING-H2 finger protein ATL63-like [Vicia villosa]